MYNFIFVNNYKMIIFGCIELAIILIAIILLIFQTKNNFLKKYFNSKKMSGYMFVLGLIIGLIITGINHFNVYDQNDNNELWIKHTIYLTSTFIGFSVNIMFIGFIILIPPSLFINLYDLINKKKTLFNLFKITAFYTWFAIIAIGVSSLQYLFKDSFFAFASNYSNHPNPLDFNTNPTLYYAAYSLLNIFIGVKGIKFGIFFILSIIVIMIIEISIILLLRNRKEHFLQKVYKISLKINSKTKILNYISPIFIFTSISTSLAVQPIATFLRIILIIMLMFIVTNIIIFSNYFYLVITGKYKITELWSIFCDMTRTIFFSKEKEKMKIIKSKTYFKNINLLSNFNSYYNIFITTIYSLIIISYLGFSSGPLFDNNFSITHHILYWLCLFFYGYILMFCYSLNFREISPYKIMLASSTPYIKTGFNTGILSYFNNIINLFACLAITHTYLVLLTFKKKKKKISHMTI